MFKNLQAKILEWSKHKGAERTLFAIAFAESSFFPLPPDLMQIPMTLARPHDWMRLAAITTAGSVLGGLLGYAIGLLLLDTLGMWVINLYGLQEQMHQFQAAFNQYGVEIIFLKGLTPIPFKLITIASGMAQFSLLAFIAATTITRGARYFLLGWILHFSGERGRLFIEQKLNWVLLACLIITVVGIAAVFAF